MAYYNTSRPAPFGALTVYAVVRAGERLLNAARRLFAGGRTEDALARMSERELADVGLKRNAAQLEAVRYSPLAARV